MPAVVNNNRSLRRQLSQAGRKLFAQAHNNPQPHVPFHRLLRCCEATARLEVVPPLPDALKVEDGALQLVVVGNVSRIRFLVPHADEKAEVSILVKGKVQFAWTTDERGHVEQLTSFLQRLPQQRAEALVQLLQVCHMLDIGEAARLAADTIADGSDGMGGAGAGAADAAAAEASLPDEPPEFEPTLNASVSSMDARASVETDLTVQDPSAPRSFTFTVDGNGRPTKLKQQLPEAGISVILHIADAFPVSMGLEIDSPPGILSDVALAMEKVEAQLAHSSPVVRHRLGVVFAEVDRDGDGLVSQDDVVGALIRAGQTQMDAERIAGQMSSELAALSADPAEEFCADDFCTFWLAMAGLSDGVIGASLEQALIGLEQIFLGETAGPEGMMSGGGMPPPQAMGGPEMDFY